MDYTRWANLRLLEKFAELERDLDGESSALTPLRATFVHMLEGDQQWRGLCQSGEDWPDLDAADFPTADAVLQAEQEEWRTFLEGFDDESLDRTVEWTNPLEEVTARPLWQVLYQVFNHGSQHRAELASTLSEHDRSPGDLDFVLFLWERDQSVGSAPK